MQKKPIILCTGILICTLGYTQNVGIGTLNPQARLHVVDSNVVFSAPGAALGTPGNPPISGSGRRFMWYADKAAIRIGYVSTIRWNKDSVGDYSVGMGYNTLASGIGAVAFGLGSVASGNTSIAGITGIAHGPQSLAIGWNAIALGSSSISMGYQSQVIDDFAVAIGRQAMAIRPGSMVIGYNALATGTFATSIGWGTIARARASTAIGVFNDSIINSNVNSVVPTDPLFMIGNGTDHNNRSNALMVLKDGNVGIGTNTPSTKLQIAGGADATLADNSGYLVLGNTNGPNMAMDENEILVRNNGAASNLYLNIDGGNILLASNANGNVGIATSGPAERLHLGSGNMQMDNAPLGINLNAADRPLITRRFDVFTSGNYTGLGRWGLFMNPSTLTLGIPNVAGKGVAVARFEANSTFTNVLKIDEQGTLTRPETSGTDLLPIAMARVNFNGTFANSTGNVSCNVQDLTTHWGYSITVNTTRIPKIAMATLTNDLIDEPIMINHASPSKSILVFVKKATGKAPGFFLIVY